MKKLITVVSVATLLAWSNASADVVNFTSTNTNMGTIHAGQTGSLFNNYTLVNIPFSGGLRAAASRTFGTLQAGNKITFSYSLSNLTSLTFLRSSGNYDYTNGDFQQFTGNAFDSTFVPATATGTINGLPSVPLVFATANISGNIGTTTISNYSGGNADFTTLFAGILRGNPTLNICSIFCSTTCSTTNVWCSFRWNVCLCSQTP